MVLRRRPALVLVSGSQSAPVVNSLDLSAFALKRSFSGWMSDTAICAGEKCFRPLTTEDFLKVEMATVRESENFRRWPQDVVAKFLAADVIKRS